MPEKQIWPLVWEDPLEKEMATHPTILVLEIPWTEEPGRLQSMEFQRVDWVAQLTESHDWVTKQQQQIRVGNTKTKLHCIQHTLAERKHNRMEVSIPSLKAVNTKGNPPWMFTRRTDAEAEAPILQPPNVKSQLIGKDSDAWKDWGQEVSTKVGTYLGSSLFKPTEYPPHNRHCIVLFQDLELEGKTADTWIIIVRCDLWANICTWLPSTTPYTPWFCCSSCMYQVHSPQHFSGSM